MAHVGMNGAARVAEVLGALSLATDMAAAVPAETSIRTCLVATAIGRALGLSEAALGDVYYTALLRHLGCTAFAHEAAAMAGGDDHELLRVFEGTDPVHPTETADPETRAFMARALADGSPLGALATAQCAQATALATDLGMSEGVVRALDQIYERFDGRGAPRGVAGEALELAARVLHVANVIEVQNRQGGRGRVAEVLGARRREQLDPAIVDAALGAPPWAILESPSVWDAYVDAEPGAPRTLDAARLDDAAIAFGRYADLKSPMMIGHSASVADLATRAARAAGVDDDATLRRAALLHDLGSVSVPNGIWEKAGPLNAAEWERVRLHAYYTERILSRVPALAPAAAIAVLHHERRDGSGYPRGAMPEGALAADVLACADAYVALTSARPYRAALASSAAAAALRADSARCSPRALEAVLAAAGQGAARALPAGLSAREAEVLAHVARGATNKEIAASLGISPRTVQHHVEHVYAKVGVSTRAAAALFAVRRGLV